MLFDPDQALEYLATDRPTPTAWPEGAPTQDFIRSPAAARIGALAAASGLFLFHFEHRTHLPLPVDWLPDGVDPELAAPPEWVDGVLPEAKYQSFRHDLLVGSFHPGHRGKWTTHELCHALVGYAWRPGATPLFHATAGRLAELLPVVLYYFLDEVRLERCADHAGGGPLFREFCPRCELAAAAGPRPGDVLDRETLADAARYLDRELAMVARTRREGRPLGYRWGSLDLTTDGLAYAAAHGRRLGSEAFARFADGFLGEGSGRSDTLEALEERVVAVVRALVLGEELEPMAPTAEQGRWRWTVQDLAWQMLHAAELAGAELAEQARVVVDGLAGEAPSPEAVRRAVEAWPLDPSDLALGYPVDGLPAGLETLATGLRSACPLALEAFEDAGHDPTEAFAAADPAERRPLADRFADWCARNHGPRVAALARFEAALRHAGADPWSPVLGAGQGQPCPSIHARVLDEELDPIELSDAVESGRVAGSWQDGRLVLRPVDGIALDEEPVRLVVRRNAAGEVAVVEIDGEDDPDLLAALGMVDFARWSLDG